MVSNKDINQVRSPGSCNADTNFISALLEKPDIEWVLDQAKGFKVYTLGDSCILFMKPNQKLLTPPVLFVDGPYEIEERFAKFTVEDAPEGNEYDELINLARKLTPEGNKLSFPPA